MKILAIEKEVNGADWKNQEESLKQEAHHVYDLYLQDQIREIYFNNEHNAVLVLECESLEKANLLLNQLPLVKNKLIEFELMELKPYSGYSRIIKNSL